VYDNKGPEKRHFGGSNDVDENKEDSYVNRQIALISMKIKRIRVNSRNLANPFASTVSTVDCCD